MYPEPFKELVANLAMREEYSLGYIGVGNPNANILILSSECSINRNSTRGEGCFIMEHLHNVKQWTSNILENKTSNEIQDWHLVPLISLNFYNPLYPYRGQSNQLAIRAEDGCTINNGVNKSWYKYQQLIDKIYGNVKSDTIIFHQYAFVSDFNEENLDGQFSDKSKKSIELRCSDLFSSCFFRSFPVVIVPCGKYIKDHNIQLQNIFDQKFIGIEEDENGWICIHENKGRILLHTKHIAACSDVLLERIADKVKKHLEKPYIKYCKYYDGTEASIKKTILAFYEHFWIKLQLLHKKNEYDEEIQQLLNMGATEMWLNSFDIPYSLIGLFFNRYCHWQELYNLKDYMNWFENVRNKNIIYG